MISPYFDIVTQAGVFFLEVIDEDSFLALVSIPPFVRIFVVKIRVLFSDTSGFAYTGGSVNPLIC